MRQNSKHFKVTNTDFSTTEQHPNTEKIPPSSQSLSHVESSEKIDVEINKEYKLNQIQQQQEKVLTREFFTVDPLTLARNLLGKIIVRKIGDQVIKCRIVETEGYGGDDEAVRNSYHGKYSERTKAAYLPGGHLYISDPYNIHYCLHFVADEEGEPAVALIRAVEILEGFEFAVQNRKMKNVSKSGKEVANGPGKICAALKIDKSMRGYDAAKPGELYVIDQNFTNFNVVESKRINIDYAGEAIHHPWRYYIENSRFVSVKGEVLKITPFIAGNKPDEDIQKCPSISLLDKFKFSK